MSVEVMFFADAGCQVMHPEIPDVDDYIDEIVYPASATPRLDSTDIRTVISEQSESESESEESSTIKVEPTSGDEEFTSDASVPRTSIVDSCANYDDGPKDPDKNQKERERNLRKGESLRLLRQKIMESGIDCECIGDEKKMTEEVTLKLTIQLIQHLRFLIRQRGGNLANCKFAVPLANRRYPEIHFRRLGYSQPPKKRQNCYIKFTQVYSYIYTCT